MKKLILSYYTYDWIKYCAGMIQRNPEEYTVIILCKDDKRPIVDCVDLCTKALYEQRTYDLFRIGKELGIKKLINLNYETNNIDIEKLIVQLQIYIIIGGIAEVYCQHIDFLTNILCEISKKSNTKIFLYGNKMCEEDVIQEIYLSDSEMTTKFTLCNLMVGIANLKELPIFKTEETFYRLN